MRIKSQVDFWSAIVFTVVGLAFAMGATNYGMGTSARPGPGYFPIILGVLLAVVGLFVLFGSLGQEPLEDDRIVSPVWRPLLVVVGSVFVASTSRHANYFASRYRIDRIGQQRIQVA
jgi:hypothetical protein